MSRPFAIPERSLDLAYQQAVRSLENAARPLSGPARGSRFWRIEWNFAICPGRRPRWAFRAECSERRADGGGRGSGRRGRPRFMRTKRGGRRGRLYGPHYPDYYVEPEARSELFVLKEARHKSTDQALGASLLAADLPSAARLPSPSRGGAPGGGRASGGFVEYGFARARARSAKSRMRCRPASRLGQPRRDSCAGGRGG